MKKKVALLMAAMLFATSVPQGSLSSMAAEETAVETELLSEETELQPVAEQTESSDAVETEAEETVAAEPVTETEAETVQQETTETEEPVSETVIPEETESEKETEAVTEVTTEEITEKVTESETATTEETTETETEKQTEAVTEQQEETKAQEEVTEEPATEKESEESTEALDKAIAEFAAQKKEVESLTLSMDNTKYLIQGIYGDFGIMQPVLKVVYTDGEIQYFNSSNFYNNEFGTGSYGNEISFEVLTAEGKKTSYTMQTKVDSVRTGKYILKVTCGEKSVECAFKVLSIEEMAHTAKELKVNKYGESQKVIISDDIHLYHFRPTETKKYVFHTKEEAYTNFFIDKSGKMQLFYPGYTNGILEAGKDYYIYFCLYHDDPDREKEIETDLSIVDQPTITGVSVKLKKNSFYTGIERNYQDGMLVTISYAEVETEQVKFRPLADNDGYDRFSIYDNYDNLLDITIVMPSGQESKNDWLDIGTYAIKVTAHDNPEVYDTAEFTVTNLKGMPAQDIKADTETNIHLEERTDTWLHFVPERTKEYYFSGNGTGYFSFTLYDVNRNYLLSTYSGDEKIKLQKGEDYYISLYSNSVNSVDFTVNGVKAAESIEVIPGTVKYLADHEEGHFIDWAFKLHYDNGTVSDIMRLNEKDQDENYVQVKEIKTGTTTFNDTFFEGKKGNYTVKFNCGDTESDAISFYLGAPDEIRMPMELDNEESLDSKQTIYRSFQVPAGKSGYYSFIYSEYNCKITVDENGKTIDVMGYSSNNKSVYYFESGKTYNIKIENERTYYGGNFAVAIKFKLEPIGTWAFESQPLKIGTSEENTGYGDLIKDIAIIPTKSGKYSFSIKDLITGWEVNFYNEDISSSISNKDGDLAGYEYVYDSTESTYRDVYSLNAGEIYFVRLTFWIDDDEEHLWEVSLKDVSYLHEHDYQYVIDKPATCGTIGSRHLECTICGDKVPQEPIWETGEHNYQWITDKNATCGTVGSKHQECTVCHTWGRETEIPATGKHHYETKVLWEPTCGTWGYQHQECTVCHKSEDEESIAPTGKHTYSAYRTIKAATVLAEGKEERTCTVCGNKESRSIKKLTAKISVSYKSVSVVAGSSVAGPKVTYAKGDKIASWKTSNKAVATVDKNGKITGKKAGTATITVTLKSKKTAKIKVTVKKKVAATRVKLNKTSLTLKKGKSFQLKATVTPKKTTDKVTYKTSNKNIVTVTSKGKLVAKKKGKATITVTAGKKKATCKVTVK